MSLPPSASTADHDVSSTERPQVWVEDLGFTTLFNPITEAAADVVLVMDGRVTHERPGVTLEPP